MTCSQLQYIYTNNTFGKINWLNNIKAVPPSISVNVFVTSRRKEGIVTPLHHYCISVKQTLSCKVIIYTYVCPDSKVHGTNMGPIWVLAAPDGPHVGAMNLPIWVKVESGSAFMMFYRSQNVRVFSRYIHKFRCKFMPETFIMLCVLICARHIKGRYWIYGANGEATPNSLSRELSHNVETMYSSTQSYPQHTIKL